MARVRLDGVAKRYAGASDAAVEDVTLEIADGELFVLLGPSGCGKSTLLKLIGGLEDPSEGEIHIGETLVNHVTHDQVEAMTMGDRIGVMEKGRLAQVGTPLEVYRRPASRFVAGFIGTPP